MLLSLAALVASLPRCWVCLGPAGPSGCDRAALRPAVALVPLLGILAGPSEALCACLQLVSMVLAARAVALAVPPSARPVVFAALVRALVRSHFAASGHTASFSSLRFNAAFVGFEQYSFARGAAMVAADTLSSTWLALAALPAMVAELRQGRRRGQTGGDPVASTGLAWLVVCFLQLASTLASLLWLRRHLMVWAVFAPRFAFEAAALVIEALAAATLAAASGGLLPRKQD